MSDEGTKAVVRRYWYELWNEKRGEILSEIAAEPVTLHFPPGQAHQPPNLTKWFETALVAFPDVHFTIHLELAEGNLVATHWSYIATNTGPFLGRPATGKQVTDTGTDIFRIKNGKITEMWVVQDSLGLLQQLGVLPA
ncbi:MAG: ester cyclase [Anaerolineaceae bacterium]|nr:ester cyclase [Anaerolineaceae bacterium]